MRPPNNGRIGCAGKILEGYSHHDHENVSKSLQWRPTCKRTALPGSSSVMSMQADPPTSGDLTGAAPAAAVPRTMMRRFAGLLPRSILPLGHRAAEHLPPASMVPLDMAEAAEWVDRLTPELRKRISEAA
jgi:hypothetical protein